MSRLDARGVRPDDTSRTDTTGQVAASRTTTYRRDEPAERVTPGRSPPRGAVQKRRRPCDAGRLPSDGLRPRSAQRTEDPEDREEDADDEEPGMTVAERRNPQRDDQNHVQNDGQPAERVPHVLLLASGVDRVSTEPAGDASSDVNYGGRCCADVVRRTSDSVVVAVSSSPR